MKIDASKLPVMKTHCATCPFKPDENGIEQDPQLAATVTKRTLFKANQICHSTEGPGREPKSRCKGSYDFNRTIYKRMGFDLSSMD